MESFAGSARIARFVARRDRVRIAVWTVATAGMVVLAAQARVDLLPTREAIEARAQVMQDNPALVAITGPGHGLEDPTIGVLVANELLLWALIAVSLMSVFAVTRHTRAEEESGRAELLRSTAVGPYAQPTGALVVIAATNALIGALAAAGLVVIGLPAIGSVAFGAAMAVTGIAMAGISALSAQVSEYGRAASGIAAAALGLFYTLRAVGDIAFSPLSWISPLGWAQALRPYADERWWTLLLGIALAAGAFALAFALGKRRDLGAGLWAQRPGPARASPRLLRPVGLALRQQRVAIAGWCVGLLLVGAVYGSIGQEVEGLLDDNPEAQEWFAEVGADLTDSFFAMILMLWAMVGAGCALQSVLRMRGEEDERRLAPLLATPLRRSGWAGGYLVVAVLAGAAALASAGLGAGVAYAIVSGSPGEVPRLLAASIVHLPAVMALVGLAVALFGLLPRAVGVVWVALGAALFVGIFAEILDLPGWLRDLSPFEHTPGLPAAEVSAAPLLALTGIAVGLALAGLLGFRRRDVG